MPLHRPYADKGGNRAAQHRMDGFLSDVSHHQMAPAIGAHRLEEWPPHRGVVEDSAPIHRDNPARCSTKGYPRHLREHEVRTVLGRGDDQALSKISSCLLRQCVIRIATRKYSSQFLLGAARETAP